MKPKRKMGELVLVEWIDAFGSKPGWHSMEEVQAQAIPFLCRTVGWVIGVTEDYIVLGSCIGVSDGSITAVSNIPLSCIRSEVVLAAKHALVYQPA